MGMIRGVCLAVVVSILGIYVQELLADQARPAGTQKVYSHQDAQRTSIYRPRSIFMADGSGYTMELSASATLPSDAIKFILPPSNGTISQILKTDGSGNTGWTDVTDVGAAASGANSDITSLSGLTTALSIAQGGTSGTTAASALTALGAASSGTNANIVELTGLTTPLSIGQGGTSGTTQATARSGIGAAASGANSDITSITGLWTPLAISQGGTSGTTASTAVSALGLGTSSTVSFGEVGTLGTPLSIGNGGTSATTAAGAATALGLGTANTVTFGEIGTLTTPLAIANGGTSGTTAATAASALGVGTEDSPQFTGIGIGAAAEAGAALSLVGTSSGTIKVQANGSGAGGSLTVAGGNASTGAGGVLYLTTGAANGSGQGSAIQFMASPYLAAAGAHTAVNNGFLWQTSASNARMYLGTRAYTTAATESPFTLSFGALSTERTIGVERTNISGTVPGYDLTIASGGAKTSSTNQNAGTLYLDTGVSTGSGSGAVVLRTATPGSSGTVDTSIAERGRFDSTGLTLPAALSLKGSTSGTVSMSAAATTTTYAMVMPVSQGAGVLNNDGSGNLSWASALVNPMDGDGQMVYGSGGTGALTKLAAGTAGQALLSSGTAAPVWGSVLASGTYSPAVSGTVNLDSISASTANYLRVGNAVTVSGYFTADLTTSATTTTASLSLPIAVSGTYSDTGGCGGSALSVGSGGPYMFRIGGGNTAGGDMAAAMSSGNVISSTSNLTYYYNYTCRLIP